MNKEFVMRGQTVSTAGLNTEVLNFSGDKPGYAYRLVEFELYPSTNIGGVNDVRGELGLSPVTIRGSYSQPLLGLPSSQSFQSTHNLNLCGRSYSSLIVNCL